MRRITIWQLRKMWLRKRKREGEVPFVYMYIFTRLRHGTAFYGRKIHYNLEKKDSATSLKTPSGSEATTGASVRNFATEVCLILTRAPPVLFLSTIYYLHPHTVLPIFGSALLFPSYQTLPVVKTVFVTLQRPHAPRRPAVSVRLLHAEHAPVPCDAHDPRPGASLSLERNVLARVQPVAIVPRLKVGGEALAAELGVRGFEARQDAREQRLEVQRRGALAEHVRDGSRGARVHGVDADAQDDLVAAVVVAALGENAPDFDVGFLRRRLAWVQRILKR
jgi:hypothetical protein